MLDDALFGLEILGLWLWTVIYPDHYSDRRADVAFMGIKAAWEGI